VSPAPRSSTIYQKPQAWRAYKRILQHAQTRGLNKGDRLPTQPELCKELGLCTNTLRAAMEALVEDGTLTSKQRVGTVIMNPAAIETVPWSIGIVPPTGIGLESYAFGAGLLLQIQIALARANCPCYITEMSPRGVPLHTNAGAGAMQADVDGVIVLPSPGLPNWRAAVRKGTPLSHTHWWEAAPHGIVVDQGAWAQDAVKVMRSRGCKRFAAAANTDRWSMPGRFWDGFDAGVQAAGLPAEAGETLVISETDGRPALDEIAPRFAHELLSRRPVDRPDALVVADDYVAAQLAFILRESRDYRPMMAVQTNKQPPQLFALPVFAYEVDSEQLAAGVVGLLLERVRNPSVAERVEWFEPRLTRREPRSYQAAGNVNEQTAGGVPAR